MAKLRYSIFGIELRMRDQSEVNGQSNQQYTEPQKQISVLEAA